jgi:hypothetical protein
MMRLPIAILLIIGLTCAGSVWVSGSSSRSDHDDGSRTPVVVELFTSEGCSSCPPADLLLQKFDAQPIAGAQLIVLSEHVDYWNHIGWTDPYSSRAYSDRQSAYGKRLRLESVYTPQMIVDGDQEFVGSDSSVAKKALEKAAAQTGKIPVRVSGVRVEGGTVKAHVEAGPLPASMGKADVVFIVALNHAESQVARGENSGRRLTHVAVVRSLGKAGFLEQRESFSRDVAVKLEREMDPSQLRVIAFVQALGQGKILGAALEKVAP